MFIASLVLAGIYFGSRRLRDFNAALVPYAGASVFSAFGLGYRYSMWLTKPPTRLFWQHRKEVTRRTHEDEHMPHEMAIPHAVVARIERDTSRVRESAGDEPEPARHRHANPERSNRDQRRAIPYREGERGWGPPRQPCGDLRQTLTVLHARSTACPKQHRPYAYRGGRQLSESPVLSD